MSTNFQKRIADLEVEVESPELLIRPDFGRRSLSYATAGSGVEAGYQAAKAALPELRALLRER